MGDTKFCDDCGEEHPTTTKYWHYRQGKPAVCRASRPFEAGFWPATRAPTQRVKEGISRERYTLGTSVAKHWPGAGWLQALRAYEALLEKQGGKCAICGESPDGNKRLQVDRCAWSGGVRGLLCAPCNRSIGQLTRTQQLLTASIKYLEAE